MVKKRKKSVYNKFMGSCLRKAKGKSQKAKFKGCVNQWKKKKR